MHQCYLVSSAAYSEKKSLLRGWLSPDVMTFPFNELCSLVALNMQQARQKLNSSLHEWLWSSEYEWWEAKPRNCSRGRALRDEGCGVAGGQEPGPWGRRGSAQQGGATQLPDGAPVGQERGRRQGSVRGLGWQLWGWEEVASPCEPTMWVDGAISGNRR